MFRNREFKRFSVLFLIIAAVSVTFSFVFNTAAGIISIISAAAFGTAFFIFTKSRYESIAQISDQIDLVLHNADQIYISESEEGELSILQSEITKMTMRIREQNSALRKEKEQLVLEIANLVKQPIKKIENLSNRFYSENLSDTEESSGLGLYITEELCHLLGAEMKLSTDGQWLSVFIYF